jgi:hypothetical protein
MADGTAMPFGNSDGDERMGRFAKKPSKQVAERNGPIRRDFVISERNCL